MKSYFIDEIKSSDIQKISDFLIKNADPSRIKQLFWIPIPEDLLSEEQYAHKKCRPHVFAVELGDAWVKFEFLIRSLNNFHCTCPGYATSQQQNFIINFAHTMIDTLNITT